MKISDRFFAGSANSVSYYLSNALHQQSTLSPSLTRQQQAHSSTFQSKEEP